MTISQRSTAASALLALALAACGAPAEPPDGDAGVGGPQVYVHLRSTHAEVAHDPSTVGQTPRGWVSGIRSLHLLRSLDDPAPLLVFDHGDGYVEASYDDGADTVVGSAPLAGLPAGSFAFGRTVHTHARFTIEATLHSSFGALPGEFEDTIVLSDRTELEGVVRDRGFFRYVFTAGGMSFPYEGSGLDTTPLLSAPGFTVAVEEGETAYYYAAPLVIDPTLGEDVHLVFEVNVHEGFRWRDQDAAGYAEGVFDTTATATEPIVQAGANGYRYFVESP